MSKLNIVKSKRFDKDVRIAIKRGYDINLLWYVVDMLSNKQVLPLKYRDHKLVGAYDGYRECHIKPNWLLIYKINDKEIKLLLFATGTHSDLFK